MTARIALRATALATAALALTACNSTKTTPTPPPAAAPAATASATAGGSTAGGSTAAAGAQGTAAKLALTAKEWGVTFKESDPYEDTELGATTTLDASCHIKDGAKDTTQTGHMQRTAFLPSAANKAYPAVFAWSQGDVYSSAAAAHAGWAPDANNKKCPTQTDDVTGDVYSGVHEVSAPTVSGADEVYAEEGQASFAQEGGKRTDPLPYMFVSARKGTVVISVFVDIETGEGVGAAEIYVQSALKKLSVKW